MPGTRQLGNSIELMISVLDPTPDEKGQVIFLELEVRRNFQA